jgi:hypothetical protein
MTRHLIILIAFCAAALAAQQARATTLGTITDSTGAAKVV